MSDPTECKFCLKEFRYKKQYNEHVPTCEFIRTRTKERNTNLELCDDEIPNPRLMYELVKHLMVKCNTLEKEVEVLRNGVKRERRKIDVLEHLQSHNFPNFTYANWLKSLVISQKHLESVFDGNIVNGVTALVEDNLANIPFISFTHKLNTLYVYDYKNSAKWEMCSSDIVNQLFDILSNRFLKSYNHWEANNEELRRDTEEAHKKKMVYKKKILGSYIFDETKYKTFKSWLYNHLKQNIKNITEYEFY